MTGEEIAGLIVGELTMNVSMSDANAAVLHDAICAAIDKERAHVAALEEENTEWKRSSIEKNRSHEEIRDRLRNQLAAKDALVGRLEKVVEAARKRLHLHDGVQHWYRDNTSGGLPGCSMCDALTDLDAMR